MPEDPAESRHLNGYSQSEENEEYYDDETGRRLLGSLDLVHDSSSYVAELLQNALDAALSEGEFISRIRIQSEGKFVFEHNGNPSISKMSQHCSG